MPDFATLKAKHYSPDGYSPDFKDKKDVCQMTGYNAEKLIAQNEQYENTCATRMSLALRKLRPQ